MEKIKDTKLGGWLKVKAPGILSLVGDLLPDKGGLGIVKNLLDKEEGVDPEEAKAAEKKAEKPEWKMTAEEEFMKDVRRLFFLEQQADNQVDNSFYTAHFLQ